MQTVVCRLDTPVTQRLGREGEIRKGGKYEEKRAGEREGGREKGNEGGRQLEEVGKRKEGWKERIIFFAFSACLAGVEIFLHNNKGSSER